MKVTTLTRALHPTSCQVRTAEWKNILLSEKGKIATKVYKPGSSVISIPARDGFLERYFAIKHNRQPSRFSGFQPWHNYFMRRSVNGSGNISAFCTACFTPLSGYLESGFSFRIFHVPEIRCLEFSKGFITGGKLL